MDSVGKSVAKRVAQQMHTGSSTNLSGGLEEGLRLIPADRSQKTTAAVLLMTDGLPNAGITHAEGIIKMIQATQNEPHVGRCVVHTFGFGSDHDATLLRKIADSSEGTYYYVQTAEDVTECFGSCLGGLLSTCAQQISLTIGASLPGVRIKKVHVARRQTEVEPSRRYRIDMGDLQAGEHRDILVDISIEPAADSAQEAVDAPLEITLSYYHVQLEAMQQQQYELVVRRKPCSGISQEEAKVERDVVLQRSRIRGVTVMREAFELAENRKVPQARQLLTDVITQIQSDLASFGCEPTQEITTLLEELEKAKSGLVDEAQISRATSAQMNCAVNSYGYQRSHGNGYTTSCQSAMAHKFTANYI